MHAKRANLVKVRKVNNARKLAFAYLSRRHGRRRRQKRARREKRERCQRLQTADVGARKYDVAARKCRKCEKIQPKCVEK